MTEKLKVWGCRVCNREKMCITADLLGGHTPEQCILTHDGVANWQETEEYEIVKKKEIKIADYKPGDREYDEIINKTIDFVANQKTDKLTKEFEKAGIYISDFGVVGFAEAEKLKIAEPSEYFKNADFVGLDEKSKAHWKNIADVFLKYAGSKDAKQTEEKPGFDIQAALADVAKAGAYSSIIEPGDQKTPNSKTLVFKSHDEMDDFLKSRVEPTAPNCSICEWKIEKTENLGNIVSGKPVEIRRCSAQGYTELSSCYNSKECRILFQQKPEATK